MEGKETGFCRDGPGRDTGAFPRKKGKLIVQTPDSSLFQSSDDSPEKSGQVIGLTGSDEVSVHGHLHVNELGAGVLQVIPDGKKGGDGSPL